MVEFRTTQARSNEIAKLITQRDKQTEAKVRERQRRPHLPHVGLTFHGNSVDPVHLRGLMSRHSLVSATDFGMRLAALDVEDRTKRQRRDGFCFPYWLAQMGANLETRESGTAQRPVLLSTVARPGGSEFGVA